MMGAFGDEDGPEPSSSSQPAASTATPMSHSKRSQRVVRASRRSTPRYCGAGGGVSTRRVDGPSPCRAVSARSGLARAAGAGRHREGSRSDSARRVWSVTSRDTTSAKYSTPSICWIITSERAWSLAGVISPNPTLVRHVKLK